MEIKDWFPEYLSLVLNWIVINPFPITKLSVDHVSFSSHNPGTLSSLHMSPSSQLDFCLHSLLPRVHPITYWPVSLAVS